MSVIFESVMIESAYNDSIDMRSIMMEITRHDILFALEKSDEGLITKAVNFIRKIIKDVKNMISKALNNISEKMRYGMLSKKKKEEYNKFCELVEKNQNVRNKKVSVKEWSRIYSEYDKTEDAIKRLMNDRSIGPDQMVLKANKLMSDLSTVINPGTAALTVDTCLIFARKSPKMAEQVQKTLSSMGPLLDHIDEELGEGEAAKLQGKLNKLSRESIFQKIMARFYIKKEKDISDCMREMLDTFKNLDTTSGKVKAAIEHRDLIRTYGKGYITDKNQREATNNMIKKGKEIANSMSDPNSNLGFVSELLNPKVEKR